MHTLRQYLLSLSDSEGLFRTLRRVEVCRDARGRLQYSAGNSAVVFRIRIRGEEHALRCYLRPVRHLREIYGTRYLEKELFVYDAAGRGTWVDAVLGAWIDGVTLAEAVERAVATRDTRRLQQLAEAFDRMAAPMVADDRAHGDLKPENIIVDPAGVLHPIDFDAAFLPEFAGEPSPELGTAAYQHPARTADDFDARLDDYPAALISTALHALALDPTLGERHAATDGLLFTPGRILRGCDAAYDEVLARFERRGMAVRYRIARLLTAPTLQLFGLAELLAWSLREEADLPTRSDPGDASRTGTPELYVENGKWGFRTAERVVVPPLYDNGFDFTEGLAAVLLGHTWHYIDTHGRVCLSCPGCETVKPFRNGRAKAVRNGLTVEIVRKDGAFEIRQPADMPDAPVPTSASR